MADGGEFGEVFPAFVGFGEEGEVGSAFAVGDFAFVGDGFGGEVNFAAEDGFDGVFFAVLVEFDGSEEVAVIGHGDGGHGEFGGAFGEVLGSDHAVKEGIGGVEVEVDEGV